MRRRAAFLHDGHGRLGRRLHRRGNALRCPLVFLRLAYTVAIVGKPLFKTENLVELIDLHMQHVGAYPDAILDDTMMTDIHKLWERVDCVPMVPSPLHRALAC